MTHLNCPWCGCNMKVASAKGKDESYRICARCGEQLRIVYDCTGTPYLDDGSYYGTYNK